MIILVVALLWAERNCTCSLVRQLLPNRLHPNAFTNLHKFDLEDQLAWDIISEAKAACSKALIVGYGYCQYNQMFMAYVFHQDDRVVSRGLPFQDESHTEKSVRDVLAILEMPDDDEFEEHKHKLESRLKELYSIFIESIADFLEHMTTEDKLVIIPFEGQNELPFQLLLDEDANISSRKLSLA